VVLAVVRLLRVLVRTSQLRIWLSGVRKRALNVA